MKLVSATRRPSLCFLPVVNAQAAAPSQRAFDREQLGGTPWFHFTLNVWVAPKRHVMILFCLPVFCELVFCVFHSTMCFLNKRCLCAAPTLDLHWSKLLTWHKSQPWPHLRFTDTSRSCRTCLGSNSNAVSKICWNFMNIAALSKYQ